MSTTENTLTFHDAGERAEWLRFARILAQTGAADESIVSSADALIVALREREAAMPHPVAPRVDVTTPSGWRVTTHPTELPKPAATAPTREEVEGALLVFDASQPNQQGDKWDWLGWTVVEWDTYCRLGTIPARPLRSHAAPEYAGSKCADCDCNHGMSPKGTLCDCNAYSVPPHPWRKQPSASAPPAVHIARRGEKVTAAVNDLLSCDHPTQAVIFAHDNAFCLACGDRQISRGPWIKSRCVAALLATLATP